MVRNMKVTQSSPEKVFNPITIVLETEEEAAIMWCYLESPLPSDGMGVRLPPTASMVDIEMAGAFEDIYDASVGEYAK